MKTGMALPDMTAAPPHTLRVRETLNCASGDGKARTPWLGALLRHRPNGTGRFGRLPAPAALSTFGISAPPPLDVVPFPPALPRHNLVTLCNQALLV
jgi:hypothetical protein